MSRAILLMSSLEPQKNHRTTLIVIIFCVVTGLLWLALWNVLVRKGTFSDIKTPSQYLEGEPVTVPDDEIRSRAQKDGDKLLNTRSEYFSGTDVNSQEFKKDIEILHAGGACRLKITDNQKNQGGFDGGANIRVKGVVLCGERPAYEVMIEYIGSGLSKDKMARLSTFTLNRIELTITSAEVLDTLARQRDKSVAVYMRNPSKPADFRQATTPQKMTYVEYKAKESQGAWGACQVSSPLSFVSTLRIFPTIEPWSNEHMMVRFACTD